jgi:hypothetical protein
MLAVSFSPPPSPFQQPAAIGLQAFAHAHTREEKECERPMTFYLEDLRSQLAAANDAALRLRRNEEETKGSTLDPRYPLPLVSALESHRGTYELGCCWERWLVGSRRPDYVANSVADLARRRPSASSPASLVTA